MKYGNVNVSLTVGWVLMISQTTTIGAPVEVMANRFSGFVPPVEVNEVVALAIGKEVVPIPSFVVSPVSRTAYDVAVVLPNGDVVDVAWVVVDGWKTLEFPNVLVVPTKSTTPVGIFEKIAFKRVP